MLYIYEPAPLATGGEKSVHLATCKETNLTVVVKFPLPPYTVEVLSHFRVEVERMIQAWQGAGASVTQVIDYNLDTVPPFYVEEYCPDGTLAQQIKNKIGLGLTYPVREALSLCRQILVGLRGIHAGNQIHRDVKPSNIMLKGGQLKIGDMGLGRTLDRASNVQTRFFRGTRGYAAPEQEIGGAIDHRADLYAVGVILHEMLTGVRGAWNQVTYQKQVRVKTLLTKLLALHRDHRHASADAVIHEIDALQAIGSRMAQW